MPARKCCSPVSKAHFSCNDAYHVSGRAMLKDEVEHTVNVMTVGGERSEACKDNNLDLPRRNTLHFEKATLRRNWLAPTWSWGQNNDLPLVAANCRLTLIGCVSGQHPGAHHPSDGRARANSWMGRNDPLRRQPHNWRQPLAEGGLVIPPWLYSSWWHPPQGLGLFFAR
ncbi:hypothetical protein CC79DRAFT_866757 [Sarocladium strictum]